jgi:hypothetical protein
MNRYEHTELKEGEIWVFNSDANKSLPDYNVRLKTMRFGKQALDINGNKLSPDHVLPVYIHKTEYDLLNKLWAEELRDIETIK